MPVDDADVKHPAKFSPSILGTIAALLGDYLPEGRTILDPFAGVGNIHFFANWQTYAIELEEPWCRQSARLGPTWCGDFFAFDPARSFVVEPHPWPLRFDAVVTSPTYGNRMADHHNAKDGSRRVTYTHVLGRKLSVNNSGAMQWGSEYKFFHATAWKHATHLLYPGGLFILNVKNHVRKWRVQRVAEWHRDRFLKMGYTMLADVYTGTPGMRFGENHEMRVDGEHVYVFRKSDASR